MTARDKRARENNTEADKHKAAEAEPHTLPFMRIPTLVAEQQTPLR
jgi:hypothetical protein